MLETAKMLKAASNGKVKLFPSLDVPFAFFLGSRENPWTQPNDISKISVDPQMVEYLKFIKTLKSMDMLGSFKLTGIVNCTSDEYSYYTPINSNLGDKSFMFNGMPSWGVENIPEDSTKDDGQGSWAVAKPPYPYLCGGTWLGINKASQHKEAAWKFIQYASSDLSFLKQLAITQHIFVNHQGVLSDLSQDSSQIQKITNQNLFKTYLPLAEGIKDKIYLEMASLEFLNFATLYMDGKYKDENAMIREFLVHWKKNIFPPDKIFVE